MADRILIVEDDKSVLGYLNEVVINNGFEADTAESGEEAVSSMRTGEYALILMDINLKGIDGFEVTDRIRTSGIKIPIIFVSARQETSDTLRGLNIGGDDYIVKPFEPVVLLARIRAAIRRSRYNGMPEQMTSGPFTYNNSTLRFFKNGTEISLSGRENAIMKLFLDNTGKIFSKTMIYELVWGDEMTDENSVTVYINRLRAKIEDDPASPKYIQNIRGIGYRFVIPENA